MTTIYQCISVQNGDWIQAVTWMRQSSDDDGATWTDLGNYVPTAEDEVLIYHEVTVGGAALTAANIYIQTTGSLYVPDGYVCDPGVYQDTLTMSGSIYLSRTLNDTRKVRLDGLLFSGVTPCISCGGILDGLPGASAYPLEQNDARDIIITDPGYIGTQARLQDITPEGCGQAYARKLGNSVRYLTVTVRIRASMPGHLSNLYRMAEGPYQVLLVTDRTIIKGYIETIAPDQSAVGTEYISLKVTVAEGL